MDALFNELVKNKNVELAVCLPIIDRVRMKDGRKDGVNYYSFHFSESEDDLDEQTQDFKRILRHFEPDIIHVFGTEYLHSYSMVNTCIEMNMTDRIVVHLQGLIREYALAYDYGVPEDVLKENGKNAEELKHMQLSGVRESSVFRSVRYVSGRTEWDYECVKKINPEICYFNIQEMMRNVFYDEHSKWNTDTCTKHRIFISQATYPIKGFHLVLDELCKLKNKYDDMMIYIAGPSFLDGGSPYRDYLKHATDERNMSGYIKCLGSISPQEMARELISANVFLSCSVLENSSNSIGEAMLIGTPIVASDVGGTRSITDDGKLIGLYSLDDPEEMVNRIDFIFSNDSFSALVSEKESKYALKIYNRDEILSKTLAMYDEIVSIANGD